LVRRRKKSKAKKLQKWQRAQAQNQIYNPQNNDGNIPPVN
jgi:hypothetical protein